MSTETVELDFSDVQDLQPFARNVPKGNYLLKVKKIEVATSKNGNKMWVVDSEFLEGAFAGQVIRERLTLTEKALFKVKGFLEALGFNVGKKKVKLPNTNEGLTKQFGGRTFGAHIDDGDPYTNSNGEEKVNSEIKFHLKEAEVRAQQTTAPDVTAPPEQAAKPAKAKKAEEEAPADEPDEPSHDDSPQPAAESQDDVADQLESFDLDSL